MKKKKFQSSLSTGCNGEKHGRLSFPRVSVPTNHTQTRLCVYSYYVFVCGIKVLCIYILCIHFSCISLFFTPLFFYEISFPAPLRLAPSVRVQSPSITTICRPVATAMCGDTTRPLTEGNIIHIIIKGPVLLIYAFITIKSDVYFLRVYTFVQYIFMYITL